MPLNPRASHQARIIMLRWWWRTRLLGRRLLILLLVLTILYGLWPYATLWSLNHALIQGDQVTLAMLVDLGAIRNEIARRLNKETVSAIDGISDDFIDWLESGIQSHGVNAVETLVTLDWVREQLTARAPPGKGFLFVLSYGFFEGPRDFRVVIGSATARPVVMRLHLGATGWRVATLYY
jgi:hypothetical protein